MSLKPRLIDGLNYVYDSGPQMTYADGSTQSRWTLVVDATFMCRFGDASVPMEAMREADGLKFQLSDDAPCRVLKWSDGVATRVRRIDSRESTASLLELGVKKLEGISQINAHADALRGFRLCEFKNLSLVNLIDLNDAQLLGNCEKLQELLLWKTDLRKAGLSWLKSCFKLRRLSFVECKGWNNQSDDEIFRADFLEIVKPSKEFRLSLFLKCFPRLDALALDKVALPMIDCEVPERVKFLAINGAIKRIDPDRKSSVDSEVVRSCGS